MRQELYYSNTDLQSTSIFTTSKGEKNFDYIESNPVAVSFDAQMLNYSQILSL